MEDEMVVFVCVRCGRSSIWYVQPDSLIVHCDTCGAPAFMGPVNYKLYRTLAESQILCTDCHSKELTVNLFRYEGT